MQNMNLVKPHTVFLNFFPFSLIYLISFDLSGK